MTLDTSDQNIYQAIGVEPIINCRGTFTIIGGSVELPEVVAAMEAASGYFVQYDELADAVGQRLAEITGADWGLIPAGCAAGLKHITAACVTGGNPEKLIRIPDLTGLDKTQVIIPRYSRNAYDHAVRSIGVEIVMVETQAELERAINPRTAMIYITTGAGSATGQPLSLEVIADVARPHKNSHPRRLRGRKPHHSQCPLAKGGHCRGLQRRQSPVRAPVRRLGAGRQSLAAVGLAIQCAAPRAGPRR